MSTNTDRDTGDKVVAWLLYFLQLAFQLFLFIFMIFSVMAGDSCGSGVTPAPRVCEGAYFATIFYGFGFVLLIAAIAVPFMIVRAGRRGRRRWLQPVYGMAFLTVGAIAYMALLVQ